MGLRKEALTLGVGLLVGAALGWLLGRRRTKRQAEDAESQRLLHRPPLAPSPPLLQPESPSTPSNLAITVIIYPCNRFAVIQCTQPVHLTLSLLAVAYAEPQME